MNKKQLVFIIRLLVIVCIAYVIVFTPENRVSPYPGYGFIAFYFATNLAVARIPGRWFENPGIFYFLVFSDTLLILAGIYLAGLAGTDLYLVYFLIICLASLGAQFKYLMINVLVFTALYGWFLYQNGHFAGEMAVSYMLRLPFIMVVALFYGYVVSAAFTDTESRIRDEQQRSRKLFESSDVFAYTVGLFGEYLSANPKLYESCGFNDEVSMLGLSYSAFHGPDETAEFQRHVNQVFEQGKPVQYESFDSGLGQWLTHTLSPIFDRSKNTVFAVGVVSKDITERVRKEEELRSAYEKLRQTRDQLIQKDKMAALGRLASGIAHEIRNPLEIISMGVEYLENTAAKRDASAQKTIKKINSAVDRASRIIDDVLKFSRKAEFTIEPVDVCALTDEVFFLAGHRIHRAGIKIFRQYQHDFIMAAANRSMLSQVLLNIVNNAVDAMEGSEKRDLTARIYTKTVSEIGYRTGYRQADYFRINGSMVVVEITDTGKGMDRDVISKIFEPFFTTKKTGEGTGLGLSLAHMIMERMMGTIDVTSRAGAYTTFYVRLQPESNIDAIKEAEHEELH